MTKKEYTLVIDKDYFTLQDLYKLINEIPKEDHDSLKIHFHIRDDGRGVNNTNLAELTIITNN